MCPLHLNKKNRLPPQLNQILTISKKIMWIDETLELVRDVIKRRSYSLKKFNRSWKISLNSFFNHLNGKMIFRKMGSKVGMLFGE
jgi:hypothetical protein